MPCPPIPLRTADRDRLVADTAARLRRGEIGVLPTETVYGLSVLPSLAPAVARVRALKGREANQPFTWHLAGTADAEPLVGKLPERIRRLAQRYWPGPLTIILPTPDGGSAGLRVPAHDFTARVIAACGEPLWMSSCNRTGEPPLVDAGSIAAAFGDELDFVVDDGPSPLGMASTIVRATTPRLEVLREGILSAGEVLGTAAERILFVCSGNTCRSPLAEALARDLAARQLGVAATDVLAYGLHFASAGTGAVPGEPASDGSLAAAAEIDLDLSAHQSQPIDRDLVLRADRIYCMGQGHRRAILAEVPDAADKVKLLRQDGRDIGDPFGASLPTYRRTRDEIRAAIGALLPKWLPQPR
jgi:tRNA threonylcarbamoyl adenosine modification protein (Sua5/YciO/YrdC/YwlC family)